MPGAVYETRTYGSVRGITPQKATAALPYSIIDKKFRRRREATSITEDCRSKLAGMKIH